jgi:hypothetical protein
VASDLVRSPCALGSIVISVRERYNPNCSNKKGHLCMRITLARRERDKIVHLTVDNEGFPVGLAVLTATVTKNFYLL